MSALAFELHAGEAALARLARAQGAATPFQSAAWLAAWFAEVEPVANLLLIEVIGPGGRLLLPLAKSRLAFAKLADLPGEKHASFHAPILEGAVEAWPQPDLLATLAEAARAAGLDAVTLRDCPLTIAGRPHPLWQAGAPATPSLSAKLTIAGPAEAVLARVSSNEDRRKLRGKTRKLAQNGPVIADWAQNPVEIQAAFAAFFGWKAARFSRMGIADPFADPAIQRFLQRAAASEPPSLRLFTLKAGDTLVAVMIGAVRDGQFSAMANANSLHEGIVKHSPGYLLVHALIARLAEDGFSHFDLGVGEAWYKSHYCPETLPLFDFALAATPKGRLAAALFLALRGVKRRLKQAPRAMALLAKARKGFARAG